MNKNKNISLWSLCAFSLTIALALAAAPGLLAQTPEEDLEREAQAIDRMIMCPVCPAETIDQAQVEISFQMRAVIREMLAEGRPREEILNYFVERYGPDILAAPPKSGASLLAWILPIVGVAAALGALFLVIRSMTGRDGRGESGKRDENSPSLAPDSSSLPPQQDDPELSPYLEIADRILASRRGMSPAPGERLYPNLPSEGVGNSASEPGGNG